jgi:hypothetical protein
MEFHYRAKLEGGIEFEVRPDQRDVALFEVQPFGGGFGEALVARPFTFARFITWSAAKRTKTTALTWEQFNAQCIEATSLDDEDDAQAGGPAKAVTQDPGQSTASVES